MSPEEAFSVPEREVDDQAMTHTVLAKSGLKRNGSITQAFEHISKKNVTYLHCQHMYTETMYVDCLLILKQY
jgi:hypothetical protein